MHRRSLLTTLGIVGMLTLSAISGCLQGFRQDDQIEAAEPDWTSELGGSPEVIKEGRVFGRSAQQDGENVGAVFALDRETGEALWTYGNSGPFSGYTSIVAADALYFGRASDYAGEGAGEAFSLRFDGEEIWSNTTGGVRSPPSVERDAIYIASDDNVIRAFEPDSGELKWHRKMGSELPRVETVEESVYVTGGRLSVLDPVDGSVRWRYGWGNPQVDGATLGSDGMVYIRTENGLAAVKEGKEQWTVEFDQPPAIIGVTPTRVVARRDNTVLVIDTANGAEIWRHNLDVREYHAPWETGKRVLLYDETLYVVDEGIRALDVHDGEEIWATETGEERLHSVTIVPGPEAESSLYVRGGDSRLYRYGPDGQVMWKAETPHPIRSIAMSDAVVLGTDQNMFGFKASEIFAT